MVIPFIPNDAKQERCGHTNSNERCSQGIEFDWFACKHCIEEDNFTRMSKIFIN